MMRFDNLAGNDKPQTAASGFGGNKRLEDGICQCRIESAAMIDDGNAHPGFFIKDMDIGSAALMHGLKRIFDNIYDSLF